MKIAVGGSAANPPHRGHKMLVKAVAETGEYNQVRWTVSGDRPDKPGLPNSRLRFEMGKMIMENSNELINVFYEPEKAIPTAYVLSNLKKCYPEAEFVWYCGADHFLPRERFNGKCDVLGFWDDGEVLFENQEFLIIPRKGISIADLQLPKVHTILDVNIPDISSTEIRRRIAERESVKQFIGKEVLGYIQEKKLYQK